MSVVATMTHIVEELLSKPCRKIMTQSPHIVVDITVILDDPDVVPLVVVVVVTVVAAVVILVRSWSWSWW